MAYINREKSAAIRKALKARFPDWKFSVRIDNHTSLDVVILSGPINLFAFRNEGRWDRDAFERETGYTQVNHFWIGDHWTGPAKDFLEEVKAICNEGNHDNSDIQTDYFDVGWYFHLSIGTWGRPFQLTEAAKVAA